jgi:hypothetical protein
MMLLGATHLLAQDQVRLLLNPQMFHHPEATHLGQHRAQLGQRLAAANPQRIEQGTATTIGQCLEHVIHRVGVDIHLHQDSFEDLR